MGYEPRADIPIYLAGLSEKMLRLAGEIADGVVLWLCNPHYIRDVVVPAVSEGRERAGLPLEGFDIVAAVPSAVTGEPEEARARLRTELVPYFSLPFYRAMIEASGLRGGRGRLRPRHAGAAAPRPRSRRSRTSTSACWPRSEPPRRPPRSGAPLPRLRRHLALRRRHHEDGLRRHARGARGLPRLTGSARQRLDAPLAALAAQLERVGGRLLARRARADLDARAAALAHLDAADLDRGPAHAGRGRCPAGGRSRRRRRARGRPP